MVRSRRVLAAAVTVAMGVGLSGLTSSAGAAPVRALDSSDTTAAENCEPAGADHLAYSSNLDTDYNSLSVIDTNTLEVVRYIPGFNVPANVTPVPDGAKLYVDNWNALDADTDVVNPCTGQVVKTIPRPGGLFPLTNLSPDGRYVYLTGIQGFTIDKIDTQTDQVVRTYSTLQLGDGEPIGYALPSPDGQTLWVAGLTSIYSIDVATGQITGTPIPSGLSPEWLAITPDGKYLLATNFAGGTDTLINTQTRSVVATVNTGLTSYPNSVSATPDGAQFWIGNLDGTVDVVDSQTGTVLHKLDPGKMTLDVTFSPDGSLAYVPTTPFSSPAVNLNGAVTAFGLMVTGLYHTGPGEIAVYSTKTGELVKTFQTGGLPSPVVTPTGPFTNS